MLAVAQELFPFIVALYLLDGLTWVGSRHLLFVGDWWGRFHLRWPGLAWTGLWPSARTFSAHHLRLGLTTDGLWVPAGEATGIVQFERQSFDFLPYGEISTLAIEGHALRLGTTRVVGVPSASHARGLLDLIHELRRLPGPERARHLEAWRLRCADLAEIQDRGDRFDESAFAPRVLSYALFGATFVLLPACLYLQGWRWLPLTPLLVYLALNYLCLVASAAWAARSLGRRGGCRLSDVVLPMLFSPPSAMRARAKLGRDLYYDFDFLALAAAVLPRVEFVDLARSELHGARHALAAASEETWRQTWQGREAQIASLLHQLGLDEEEVLAPPLRQDSAAVLYCPLCRGEYRGGFTTCSSCGAGLVPLGGG